MLFTHWVARFGAPRLITTDQGSQFEAQLFNTLTKLVGSKHCRITAYHPESNGIIERWHRSLKTALICHSETQWTDTLPVVLLGLRTCLKEDLGTSVAELVYGTTLKVPDEFFSSEEMPSNPRIFVEDFRVISCVIPCKSCGLDQPLITLDLSYFSIKICITALTSFSK